MLVSRDEVAIELTREREVDRTSRCPALDFTRGVLVVLMFVGHATNYFGPDKELVRYQHFVPSSFIFMSGFFVSFVQYPKYERGVAHIRRRLRLRGAKLASIFFALNLAAHLMFSRNYNSSDFGLSNFFENIPTVLVSGGQASAIFDILLPISYLLLLSSVVLTRPGARHRWLIGIGAAVLIAGCTALSQRSMLGFNLEFLSMGFFGMALGLIPLRRITRAAQTPLLLLAANAIYIALVAVYYPTYAINIVGIVLALLLFFSIGSRARSTSSIYRWFSILGRYSLIGYITHISILQLIFRSGLFTESSALAFVDALVTTAILTTAIIATLDAARRNLRGVDFAYRLLFA